MAALLLPRWHLTERVLPKGYAPWSHSAFLRRRRLGFPLRPFVRGLMYYYEIDFHDLSPNSFLNISTFIVVCEAFLRISPHFGLWLKIFNVNPKVVGGGHAECGGAMVSNMPNITWPTCTFTVSTL